jgi:3-hydroxybutyryl-CoA dehydrogenase
VADAPDVIGVVGAGTMGAGIAQLAAAAGARTLLHDPVPDALERGLSRIADGLERWRAKGRLERAAGDVSGTAELGELAEAGLVIEAAPERLELKRELFAALGDVAPRAVLASNTSSIPIASLGAVTGRPDKVIGMHFFNPVPVLRLVEVIRTDATSEETSESVLELARDLGKEPAEARDFPGFVSNRILMPFVNEAAYALMDGVAEAEAIDTIARLGFAHPMGPLALADLIGLDTCVAIMEVLHEGLGDDKYAPCPLLREHVAAGRLGRKSGRGFYEYG